MSELRVLDLFSGIGGFSLGLERTGGFQTVAFCEIDAFCRKVLARHWPNVPIFEDVTTLTGGDVGAVDVVCGGYPCQPFSVAGKRGGAGDDRQLWPEMHRLLDELRPSWVIGENVAGHIGMGLDDVLSDLEALGYACRPFTIPAVAVDAKHRRFRVWIVAHREEHGCRPGWSGRPDPSGARQSEQALPALADPARHVPGRPEQRSERERVGPCGEQVALADADHQGPQGHGRLRECAGEQPARSQCRPEPGWWLPEPDVGRVAHGVPDRVDRLRALGNAVVPQIPEIIGRAILTAEATRQEVAA